MKKTLKDISIFFFLWGMTTQCSTLSPSTSSNENIEILDQTEGKEDLEKMEESNTSSNKIESAESTLDEEPLEDFEDSDTDKPEEDSPQTSTDETFEENLEESGEGLEGDLESSEDEALEEETSFAETDTFLEGDSEENSLEEEAFAVNENEEDLSENVDLDLDDPEGGENLDDEVLTSEKVEGDEELLETDDSGETGEEDEFVADSSDLEDEGLEDESEDDIDDQSLALEDLGETDLEDLEGEDLEDESEDDIDDQSLALEDLGEADLEDLEGEGLEDESEDDIDDQSLALEDSGEIDLEDLEGEGLEDESEDDIDDQSLALEDLGETDLEDLEDEGLEDESEDDIDDQSLALEDLGETDLEDLEDEGLEDESEDDIDDQSLALEDSGETDLEDLEGEGLEDESEDDIDDQPLVLEDSGEIDLETLVDDEAITSNSDLTESENLEDTLESELQSSFSNVTEDPIDEGLISSKEGKGFNRILALEYDSKTSGGALILRAKKTLNFSAQYNSEKSQFIITFKNVLWPEILKHPLYLKDFKQSFGAVKASSVREGSIELVVQINNDWEPNILTNGRDLMITPGTQALSGNTSAVSPTASLGSQASSLLKVAENSKFEKKDLPQDKNPLLKATTLEEFLLETGTFYGDPISLQVNNEEISTVIGFIADYVGANIVLPEDVKGRISIKLREVPWDQALLTIMKSKKLGYVRTGNILRVAPIKDLREESQAAVEIRKAQTEIEPTQLRVIPLEYADPKDIQSQVVPFSTPDRGSVTTDIRTSSIIVNDTKEVIQKMERLIKELDLPPPQVLIESKIVEATKRFAKSLGIRWGATGLPFQLSPSGGASGQGISIFPSLALNNFPSAMNYTDVGSLAAGLNIGTIDFLGNLTARLGLSETDDEARVISSPRIVTVNNEEGVIRQQTEILRSQITTTGNTIQETVTSVPVILELKVKPQITSGASVLLDIELKNEFAGPPQGGVSPKNNREANVKVLVENNKTAVIGGVYDKNYSVIEQGIPILKDIPIIGWLFKYKVREKKDTEIMLFITPRILDKNYQSKSASL